MRKYWRTKESSAILGSFAALLLWIQWTRMLYPKHLLTPFDRSTETVYFMFATVPPHRHRIAEVIKMMREQQSLVPDGVILTIPEKFKRFEEETIADPGSFDGFLRIHRVKEDLGPLAKYQGVALLAPDDDNAIVVISDDDVDFGRTFVEDFARAVAAAPRGTMFTGQLDRFRLHGDSEARSDGIKGYSGVGARAYMLRNLPKSPEPCFLADDVVISYHAKRNDYAIKLLKTRRKNRDSKEQHDATSINAYHRDEEFHVNDMCSEALFLQEQQQ